MKRTLKNLFRGLGILILILLLLAGFWVGGNLWPQPGPSELFPASELDLKEIPTHSLWLQEAALKQTLPQNLSDLTPFEQMTMVLPQGKSGPGDAWRFWNEAATYYAPIALYFQNNPNSLQGLQSHFQNNLFADTLPLRTEGYGQILFTVRDLHLLAWGYVLQLALSERYPEAFAFLLKMIGQDGAWAETARPALSHLMALDCLKKDLQLLLMLRYRYAPPDWSAMVDQLNGLDVGKFDFRKAIVFEYHYTLSALKAFEPGKQANHWFWELAYHPNRTRQLVNDLYQDLDKQRQNLSLLRPESTVQMENSFNAKVRGPFWWWRNPGGKILVRLLWVNPVGMLSRYAADREEINALLGSIRHFQEPETRPETQPMVLLATPPPATPVATPLAEVSPDASLEEKLQSPDQVMVVQLKASQVLVPPEGPKLGDMVQLLPLKVSEKLSGLKVGQVNPKTPWEYFGLQAGDVVFAFNGREVSSDLLDQLNSQMNTPAGKIEWLVYRHGRWIKIVDEWAETAVKATPEPQPPNPPPPNIQAPPVLDTDAL